MKLRLYEVAQIVHACNDYEQWPNVVITNVEFDSRKITAGSLFVPLQGESDGHDYVKDAMANGAAAALWQRPDAPNFPYLQVEDTLVAMQQLAIYYRDKVNPKVLAITGSNGKTTTKDMTAAVMATEYETYKTQGNYNNEIGVPYTILHMPSTTEVLVLEMGMDGAGQIEVLSNIARPDAAAITMIGESHIEHLGNTRQGIADAKMEITAGLATNGLLLAPYSEPLLDKKLSKLSQTVRTFGLDPDADIHAEVLKVTKDLTYFETSDDVQIWEIPVIGDYNVTNALIAIGFGDWMDIDVDKLHEGLAHFQLTMNRTQWLTATSGAELLSDVYNANPTAMKKVIDNFVSINTDKTRAVVLGDMLELGSESQAMHESIAEHISPATIQDVFLYGDKMKDMYRILQDKYQPMHIHHFATGELGQLTVAVTRYADADKMLLLKASNGMQLVRVVQALTEES